MTDQEISDCAQAIDDAWRAIDDNIEELAEKSPGMAKLLSDYWNAISAAHMKLTIARLKESSMNFTALTQKVKKTTTAIEEALAASKLGPEVIGMFTDATKLATTAVKFVDEAQALAKA